MAQHIQVRRGTAASATSINPILADGEIGLETDTGKFKWGDGVTAWNSLGYSVGIALAEWGNITGDPADQADMKTFFDTLYQSLSNTATVLTDAATIDVTGPNHTLTTASSRTFTKSYTGDESSIMITLNATSATFTLPSGHKGIFNGTSSGTNSIAVTGATSGDLIGVTIGKIGSTVVWIAKNISR